MDPETTPWLPEGMREHHADLPDVRLHWVEAGEGPLVVLLHGFPEFWYGWHRQIPPLAQAGFRVVAPDLRGFNLSGKPEAVGAYRIERVAGDVSDLIGHLGAERAHVVGHDWGAITAWALAAEHPEVVDRLVTMNGPHPRRLATVAARRPVQVARLWYALGFQVPWLPERLMRAGNWRVLRQGLRRMSRPGTFSDEDVARYVEAWARPGAITAMTHYYRAGARHALSSLGATRNAVQAPTRVIWGDRDVALRTDLAEPSREDVPNLERVIHLPEAGHLLQHEEPERVVELLVEFLR